MPDVISPPLILLCLASLWHFCWWHLCKGAFMFGDMHGCVCLQRGMNSMTLTKCCWFPTQSVTPVAGDGRNGPFFCPKLTYTKAFYPQGREGTQGWAACEAERQTAQPAPSWTLHLYSLTAPLPLCLGYSSNTCFIDLKKLRYSKLINSLRSHSKEMAQWNSTKKEARPLSPEAEL